MKFGDVAAVCDVDANHMGAGRDKVKEIQGKPGVDRQIDMYEDYRKILDRDDIEVVTIVTPDHWHSKIAIEAMLAGKDVYCEKPLTLTIEEGKQIISVLDKTNRVFQVGTQQRSEMGSRFLTAIAMIRDGRIGKIKNIICDIGGAPTSDALPVVDVPQGLNWDMWLGQAPLVDYRFRETSGRHGESRCHYEFRWWYEYSGGKMTDWGAHHVDIASWALGEDAPGRGPKTIEPISAEHPVPFQDGYPTEDDRYNTATKFDVLVTYPSGVTMRIVSHSADGNGLLFEGTEGRFHVNRSRMKGAPVDELESNPLPEGAVEAVYGGKKPGDHMGNFFECVVSRDLPISDVYSHHRAMTTCHLANISIRLGKTLQWDPTTEQMVGDQAANQWQSREQRKGYEIKTS